MFLLSDNYSGISSTGETDSNKRNKVWNGYLLEVMDQQRKNDIGNFNVIFVVG